MSKGGSKFGFLPPPRLRVDRIEQTPAEIRIRTQQKDANGANTVERRLPLDGSPVEVTVLGRVRSISARWEGEVLVISTVSEVSGRPRLLEDRWSLSQDGSAITIQRRHGTPGGAVHQRLLLRKTESIQYANRE